MSSLKMYCKNPSPRGKKLPEGFSVVKYAGEDDIADWLYICKDGLIGENNGPEKFYDSFDPADGPDVYRDVYFIRDDKLGKKIATFAVIPDMWHTGMGYIHMVAVRHEYRGLGLGSFLADYCLKLLKDIGKPCNYLLTGDARLSAVATYLKAGFIPVNWVDDEGLDMIDRWKVIMRKLGLTELPMLNEDGSELPPLRAAMVDVTEAPYCAKGDGVTNDRAAIQAAIDDVARAGGGIVALPAGKTFLTGSLVLRSQVDVQFGEGAVLQQSGDPADYVQPVGEWDYEPKAPFFMKAKNCYEHIKWAHAWYFNLPFLYAPEGTHHFAVTGKGTIRMMDWPEDGRMMRIAPVGLYRAHHFEVADIHITNYHAYAVMPYTCSHGVFRNLTIDGFTGGNEDGISLMNSQHIRITGCTISSGDDAIYIFSSYRDPRGNTIPTWWSSDEPQACQDIEIDHCNLNANGCKGLAIIPWGIDCPDLEKVEVRDLYVHDNVIDNLGIWNYNPYTSSTAHPPVTHARFANNAIKAIEPSFFALPMADVQGFASMEHTANWDFRNGMIYWSKCARANCAGVACEEVEDGNHPYGFIDHLERGYAALYQGLHITSGKDCLALVRVRINGEGCRIFVRDQETAELIASKEITGEDWHWDNLVFRVPKEGNYHVGIECDSGKPGFAHIDHLMLHGNTSTISGYTRIGVDPETPHKVMYYYDSQE